MTSSQTTVDYIADQAAKAGTIRSKKMFGEYALYCDEKVVAFVCDDILFLKITDAGRALIKKPVEAPAYPGSKMYFKIDADIIDDRDLLTKVIRATAAAVPMPASKKAKQIKKRSTQ